MKKTTLNEAVIYSKICFGVKFKLGRKIYSYVDVAKDYEERECTIISTGEKVKSRCSIEVLVVKDEKNQYQALSLDVYGEKTIEIIK